MFRHLKAGTSSYVNPFNHGSMKITLNFLKFRKQHIELSFKRLYSEVPYDMLNM